MLEAVQAGMDAKTTPHLDLALDAGALRFRRGLQALIDRESTPAPGRGVNAPVDAVAESAVSGGTASFARPSKAA